MLMSLVTACGAMPADGIGDVSLEGGAPLRSVAAARGESVVLVLSPEDCVSCDVHLAEWLGPGRDTARHVAVVLTRAPSATEARSIALLRMPVAGRLDEPGDRRLPSPCLLRFRDGKPVGEDCEPIR